MTFIPVSSFVCYYLQVNRFGIEHYHHRNKTQPKECSRKFLAIDNFRGISAPALFHFQTGKKYLILIMFFKPILDT